MKKRKISIADISLKAGVFHTAVCRALRDSHPISLKVGIVITSITAPFFAEVVKLHRIM